jgi:hypothetical protein
MVSEFEDIRRDYKTTFVVGVVLLVFMFLSGYVLTAGRGLQDPVFVNRFILYSVLGGAGLLFIFLVDLSNFVTGVRRLKTIVHDPEESILRGVKAVGNPLLLVLLIFMLFTIPLFFLGKVSNTFFSSIPFAVQSISSFGNIWSDSVFPALAENLFIFIGLALVYTWNFKKNFAKRKALFFSVNLIFIPVIFAFLWMFFHLSVYGSSESALVTTLVFGGIGVLVSMLTMSILPWIVIHFLTNFMLALKKYGLMSSDSVVVWAVLFEVLVVVLFVVIYRLDRKKYEG